MCCRLVEESLELRGRRRILTWPSYYMLFSASRCVVSVVLGWFSSSVGDVLVVMWMWRIFCISLSQRYYERFIFGWGGCSHGVALGFGGNGITKVISSVGGYSELLCALSTVRVAFFFLTGLTCCLVCLELPCALSAWR